MYQARNTCLDLKCSCLLRGGFYFRRFSYKQFVFVIWKTMGEKRNE